MITSMRGCVAHIDRWSWPINLMLFSCDVAYFMDDIHMWHEYNPWRDDVSRTIPRLIGQWSMSHNVFTYLQSGRGYASISRIYNFKFPLDLITAYYRVGSNLTALLSLTYHLCGQYPGTPPVGDKSMVVCSPYAVAARYVYIQVNSSNGLIILELCEVWIYASKFPCISYILIFRKKYALCMILRYSLNADISISI